MMLRHMNLFEHAAKIEHAALSVSLLLFARTGAAILTPRE